MEQTPKAQGTAIAAWLRREHLVPALALLALTAAAWAYTISNPAQMHGHAMLGETGTPRGMELPVDMERSGSISAAGGLVEPAADAEPSSLPARVGQLALFLVAWAVMMVAMMLPSALPVILLYRGMARKRSGPPAAAIAMGVLLLGYLVIWTLAGLPVYAYNWLAAAAGPLLVMVPGLLLIAGGIYQFTALKQSCHARCSNPLFFLAQQWRPGLVGALRLGILHGIDCLGCCVGLMVSLVALGMVHVAWMLTATLVIFLEKTLPGGQRVAWPLGLALVVAGLVLLGAGLRQGLRM